MRILNIRIRNLNSLAGEWAIDLTAPEYAAGGIFAITGPTGAGKSTILDAVCLALYGRTPRLDRVTKSSNEIMSRRTGECWAEVTFMTMKGTYTCSWHQNRARKKPSGELQPPRHILYDGNGLSLAEKTTDVAARVEEITGMDFRRFTQSMLLAQGHFASFLLADGDRRAPLLEQITGTAVYSDISRRVHERNRAEQLRLEALDRALSGYAPLSEDEEKELRAQLAVLAERRLMLSARERDLRESLAALDRAAALEEERLALEQEQERLRQAERDFRPYGERLERALAALNFSGTLSAVHARREEHERDAADARRLESALPELKKALDEREQAARHAEKALDREKAAQAALLEALKEVRKLDAERAARGQELAALEEDRRQKERMREQRLREQAACAQDRERKKKRLEALSAERERRAADAALPGRLAGMQARLEALDAQEKRLRGMAEQREAKLREARLEERELARKKAGAEELSRARQAREEALAAVLRQQADVLAGQPVAARRGEKDALAGRLALLETAQEALRQRQEALRQREALRAGEEKLSDAVRGEQEALRTGGEALALLREKRERLAETAALKERIRGYEQERRLLREGQPCPLCGAEHHPFALTGPDDADPRREQDGLEALRRELEERRTRLDALRAGLAGHERDLVHLRARRQEWEEQAHAQGARLREALAAFSPALGANLRGEPEGGPLDREESALLAALLPGNGSALPALLERLREGAREALRLAADRLQRFDALEQEARNGRDALDALRREEERAQAGLDIGERKLLRLRAEQESLEREQGAEALRREENEEALRQALLACGVPAPSRGDLRRGMDELAARSGRYAELLAEEDAARNALAALETQYGIGAEKLSAVEQALREREKEHAACAERLAALARERRALFGDRHADAEEQAAAGKVRAGEEALARLRNAVSEAARAADGAGAGLAEARRRMERRAPGLLGLEAALRARLEEAGFPDEASCLAALLPEEELNALRRKKAGLSEQALALETRLRENARKRLGERQPPQAPREELLRGLEEAGAGLEAAAQATGSLVQKLSASDEQKESLRSVRAERDRQARACRRWNDLNELIGSADGKKFRNYAQELTFRRLIVMANRQLAAMTDRYLLVHSEREPLALNVIDRYQADEVRSSRNLSGGESFIVSLALALGLAQMAGRNVRVDSVFLDEGFGSLDEEALNTALDMLSALHRKGKVIGIISHVQAVRERVNVRIQVEPAGNGHSRLKGPGVTGRS